MNVIKRFIREEKGQGLIEYVLIIALIAIACIGALQLLRGQAENALNDVGSAMENPHGG